MNAAPFGGCKLALIHAGQVLVYMRDRKAGIPCPGMLDFPGGGREGDESPEQCVLRELSEEFGISVPVERLSYRREYVIPQTGHPGYFFAGEILASEIEKICFGDEGMYWQMMAIDEYLSHPLAVSHLGSLLLEFHSNAPIRATDAGSAL